MSTPAQPLTVKPWSEIARNFDPMMPADQYDALRSHYFYNFVAPHVPEGKSVDATFAEFKKLTERPNLLSAKEHLALYAAGAVGAMQQSMMEGLPKMEGVNSKALVDKTKWYNMMYEKLAEREGIDLSKARVGGSLTGQAADLALYGEVLGPMATGLSETAGVTARNAQLLARTLRGGLTFGAYDAMAADDKENRLMAGMKGFAVGATLDLGLGMPGYLKSMGAVKDVDQVEKALADMNAGVKPPLTTDLPAAKRVAQDADVSRLELRPEKGFHSYTLGKRGSRVIVRDIADQQVPIEIRNGREYEAYRQVRQLVDQGGSVVHYEVHPDDSKSLGEFIRIQSAAEEAKYRGTVIRTPVGKSEDVAKVAKAEGLPAQVLSKDTVEVPTVTVEHPVLNKPEVKSVVATPERKPSDTEISQAMDKRNLDAKTRNFLSRQLEVIWDTNTEYEDKRKSIVIAARYIPEMLPEQFRAKMPPVDVTGQLVKEVAESRVNAASDRALGYRPNIDFIRKGSRGQVVVDFTTKMTNNEIAQLQKELGPEYELNVPKPTVRRTAANRLFSDEEIQDMLEFHNVKPEDVDVEAIREGGQAELIRQLEVKHPELYGRRTPPAKPSLIDKVPRSEQRVYSPVKDGIKAEGVTHSLLQDALDDSGDHRFLANPAGQKSVLDQVQDATLNGRLLGSIEDVKPEQLGPVGAILQSKGWKVLPIKGYESGKLEVLYFREQDLQRVVPLIQDYDQFVSQQAGRIFDSDGKPIRDIGDAAHARLGKAFGIPADEIAKFDKNRVEGTRPAPEIASKPYGNRLIVQQEDMQRLFPGAEGLATQSIKDLAGYLGVELPSSLKGGENMIILTPEADKQLVFHERLHVNSMHAGAHEDFPDFVSSGHKQTALEIARGLMRELPGYAKLGTAAAIDEAFTHAATAIRYADKPYLEHLARYDKSIQHVMDFVHDTANNLLEQTFKRMDSVPIRTYQRTLWDLMRRTHPDVSEALRQAIRSTGTGIAGWYRAADDVWVLKDAMNSELEFRTIDNLWDYLVERDKNFAAPSASLRSELGGVRGPLAPSGREPDGHPLPVPEQLPEGRYVGMSAASGLWRPFFPWLATLHENINNALRASGTHLPVYDLAKDVDDAYRAGDRWQQEQWETVSDLLRPFKGQKMHSVFDYLTHTEPERTSKLMEKYGLNQADAIQAHKVWEWMKEFRGHTQIDLPQYMLEFHPKLRGFGWAPERVFGMMTTPQKASFWDRLIRHDMKWDPQDAHLGRLMTVMVREGMEKKYTGKALDAFEKLVERKSPDGTYVIPQAIRWPMSNYVRYMRGIPDTSQQVINKTMNEFFSRMNSRVVELNKHLPKGAQLPEFTAPPRQTLNRFMLLSYSMGLGLRPAIALRDMMQAFTGGMTVLGPGRFTRAFTSFMSNPSRGFELADAAGALLRKNNAGELLGDITSEIPTAGPGWMDRIAKWSNMALAPSRWGHNFGRAIMYNGEFSDALDGIKAFRAGRINVDQLTESTSLWFMDKPAQTRLLRYITDAHTPAADAATKVALEAVDLTQWPYRRGTQPTLLRYGVGRIFGQYAVWPANYADFLYRIGKKFSERPKLAARTAATWAAVNYSLSHAMEAAGADTSRWWWQSPAGFAGSPHWDFIHAAMIAPENTEEGRAARKTLLEYPLNFVPALSEMKSVAKALEGSGNEWPPNQADVLRSLGFKPIDQVQRDQSWQDFVETQLGYKSARRTR